MRQRDLESIIRFQGVAAEAEFPGNSSCSSRN
jgi:hypothetical protein